MTGFYHTLDPVFLHLGPLEIRYYGLVYLLGFILSYFLIYKLAQEKKIKLSKDDVSDLLTYALIGDILGARIFEILFYEPSYYFSNPFEMIAIWKGGLSFHGALVGIVIATLLYCKKKHLPFYEISDIIIIPVSLSLFFGRIANFINGELYGKITNLPWGVKFQNADGFRHPTQFYEAGKNLLIFFMLWNVKKDNNKPGYMTGLFFTAYGTLRFFIEFLKDPLPLGGVPFGLTVGQWLNIPMILFGVYLLYSRKKDTKDKKDIKK